jgi:hypothetical protein
MLDTANEPARESRRDLLLNSDAIQADAEAIVGMTDPDKALFKPNLDRLVKSVNATARLSPQGYAITHAELVDAIVNRLESRRWLDRHPEIAEQSIVEPIFMTGLPRSGTTYFQNLFNIDPAFRQIRAWEASRICPPPAVDPTSAHKRFEATRREIAQRVKLNPEYNAIHLSDADGPEECHPLLTQTFGAAGYHNYLNVPDYFDYLTSELNLEQTYRNHRQQLQLLQWGAAPKRWALKYPNHLVAMDVIMAIHPDARFIVTHRDPRQTLASLCRLTHSFRAPRSEDRDALLVGRQMRAFVRRHLDGLMAFAASAHAGRAIHVDYYYSLEQPAEMMAGVYRDLNLEMAPAVAHDIRGWVRRNPKNKRGANDYMLADYGLDADEIAEEYADYITAFDIPSESKALARLSA